MVAGGESSLKVEVKAEAKLPEVKGIKVGGAVDISYQTDFKGDQPGGGGLAGDLFREGATLTGGGPGYVSYTSPDSAFGAGSAGK